MARPKGIPSHKKINNSNNCIVCENAFKVANWDRNKKYCSYNCYWHSLKKTMKGNKNFKGLKGVQHPNWKGGITCQRKRIRATKQYSLWRGAVFSKDDYTCQLCKAKGCYLEAHHIKPQSEFPEHIFDLQNGMTLCRPCHVIVTWGD